MTDPKQISSSLYSMLPSARRYLEKGGLESRPAGFVLIVCFLLGALGIGVLSRIIHRFIPHSIVGCNHDHGDEEESLKQPNAQDDIEATPLHPTEDHGRNFAAEHAPVQTYGTMPEANGKPGLLRRPSLNQISSRVSQLVSGHKMFCDEDGQCHGFSDPCGKECFRIVQQSRTGVRLLGGFGKVGVSPKSPMSSLWVFGSLFQRSLTNIREPLVLRGHEQRHRPRSASNSCQKLTNLSR